MAGHRSAQRPKNRKAGPSNTLYYGDNLDVLRKYIPDASIDLCYIDPPFNSKRNYNQIYNNVGKEDRAQAQAFIDTWVWDDQANEGLTEIVANDKGRFSPSLIELTKGLHAVLGKGSLLAYLVSLALRVTEIHRCLKSTGSFYLHCDPTASHYIKLILDSVFVSQGGEYQNEIVWRRTGSHNKTMRYGPIHDVILFYTKSETYTWNRPKRPYMVGHVNEHFVKDVRGYRTNYYGNVLTGSGTRNGESGKPWRGIDPTAKGRHWAIPGALLDDLEDEDFSGMTQHQKLDRLYELGHVTLNEGDTWPLYQRYIKSSDGQPLPDIWAFQPYTNGTVFNTNQGIDEDVRWLSPKDQERLGYPTQKPESLLRRIIGASTNEGDVVLDAFCGCGTTITVSEQMKRRWIGVDITFQSISLILRRLEGRHGAAVLDTVDVNGIPQDMESARALAAKKDDRLRKEFEKWAVLTYTANRAVINDKKGGDQGIDGRAYFLTSKTDSAKVVFQVKSGAVDRGDVSMLNNDRDRDRAELAVMITLQAPTAGMVKEAKSAGQYRHALMGRSYDRVKLVTIADIVEGNARLELPLSLEVIKQASAASNASQGEMFS